MSPAFPQEQTSHGYELELISFSPSLSNMIEGGTGTILLLRDHHSGLKGGKT